MLVGVALLMVPAGIGFLGCSMCAASGATFSVNERIGYLIGALICLAILVGGSVAIAKLGKKQAP